MRLPIENLLSVCVISAACVVAGRAEAYPILTIAAGQCGDVLAPCNASNGDVAAHAFFPSLITSEPGSFAFLDFQSAFDSWNNSLAVGNRWTLRQAELSDYAKLTVTLYRGYVNEGATCGPWCGGAEIKVTYTPARGTSDPPAIAGGVINDGDAIWAQAIETNQKRNPSLPGNPYLDNAPGTIGAGIDPPAYPFQYNGSFFYDKPGRDADAEWEGFAYLSTADFTHRILTTYDGIEWGFTVTAVPEPWTLAIFATGLLGMVFARRKSSW